VTAARSSASLLCVLQERLASTIAKMLAAVNPSQNGNCWLIMKVMVKD